MEKCYVTNNKINIYKYPGNHVHSFSLSMYVKAGSMYETSEDNGISHFIEHIVIRNINHLMGGELYRYLDRYGLMFNACTYKEFVQFEITGAAKNFYKAADVFVKLFEEISLPASEIDIERNRIKAEIREDDDKDKLTYFANQTVWKGTSLAQTITGNSTGLNRMGKSVLKNAHRKIMVPDNLFVYVTGRAGDAEIAYLTEALEKYELKQGGLERNNAAALPEEFADRGCTVVTKQHKDSVVRFSFDLEDKGYPQAAYMLLYDILFDCENSKLHQALSEEAGFIYSFDSVLEEYSNIGVLSFQYEVQPVQLLESVEIVVRLLKELKKGITDELDYVRPTYIDNSELILDDPSDFNWMLAFESHILSKVPADIEKRKAGYESVTPEQLTKLAREIFRTSNLVVSLKGKKSIRTERKIKEIMAALDWED